LDFGYKREFDNSNKVMDFANKLIENARINQKETAVVVKPSNFSRQETKSSDTLILGHVNKQNSEDSPLNKFKTDVLFKKKKDNTGAASVYVINNKKDLSEKINLKTETSDNPKTPSLKITKINENKKPFNELARPNSNVSKEKSKISSKTNFNKVLDPKYPTKIKGINSTNIMFNCIPSMTPKSSSQFNLLKVR